MTVNTSRQVTNPSNEMRLGWSKLESVQLEKLQNAAQVIGRNGHPELVAAADELADAAIRYMTDGLGTGEVAAAARSRVDNAIRNFELESRLPSSKRTRQKQLQRRSPPPDTVGEPGRQGRDDLGGHGEAGQSVNRR